MVAVRIVQAAGDEVVHVVAVRHGFVAALRPVGVLVLVARSGGGVVGRVRAAHRYPVLVDVVLVGMVQTAVVQVVDVSFVAKRDVPTARAVLVIVTDMDLVLGSHASTLRPGSSTRE
jgi:hypothetical protein